VAAGAAEAGEVARAKVVSARRRDVNILMDVNSSLGMV
jgi:hypothetical protein